MKMYVITIMDNEKSVQVADRCIQSGLVFGNKIEKHPAYSPQNCDVYEELKKLKYPPALFHEKYSRPENCIAGYLSHQTHIVIASELESSELEGDEPEKLEIVKCPLNSIPAFLLQQKNIDSRVFAAIFIYLNFLKDE